MSFSSLAYAFLERPYFLLLIIPLLGLLIYYINKDLIQLSNDKGYRKNLNKRRKIILASRIIIVILLLIALASPYKDDNKLVQGDPKVKILIDNSTSMQLYETNNVLKLKEELEKRIPTEIEYIATGEETNLGDSILANLRKNDNILFFSDGNNNKGADLGDVALAAINYNSTISALELKPKYYDASLRIIGSEKTVSKAENVFIVKIQQTEKRKVYVLVEVDGRKIIDKTTDEDEIKFTQSFENGYHRITAKIIQDDHFIQNNIYYKTVKVVPKPKLGIYGGNKDLITLLDPLYELNIITGIDEKINDYSAIIIDNKDASTLNDKTNILGSYIAEGNGMLVIGGDKSYDTGNYKGSRFEQLLPVYIAKAGRKKGETSVIFVIDISGSTGHYFGNSIKTDVEKTIAINMIKDLSLTTYVGAVAFNDKSYTIQDIGLLSQEKNLEDNIAKLTYGGNTYIEEGILKAVEMLQNRGGSKNIIFISDGKTQHEEESKNAFKLAATKGIRIYSIGVGDDTYKQLMKYAADTTGGVYFEPEEDQGIKLLFGNEESSGNKKIFPLYIFNKNHFITDGLKLTATIYGFNQVVQKTSSRLLITTDIGDPVLTAGRYGLGRVAALTTDYGTYGFELLNKQNSLLFTRTINWIIGDPERKNENFVEINDGRINEDIDILIKSKQQPTSDKYTFYKVDEDIYMANAKVDNIGFNTLQGAVFAINYPAEYEKIGNNDDFQNIITATNGKIFKDTDAEQIAEFIKTKSKRQIVTKSSYSWILILIALLLYTAEIIYRRLKIYKNQ